MEGTDGGRLHGLANEPTVDVALDAIDQALEQVLIAATEREQYWQLNQASLVVGRPVAVTLTPATVMAA